MSPSFENIIAAPVGLLIDLRVLKGNAKFWDSFGFVSTSQHLKGIHLLIFTTDQHFERKISAFIYKYEKGW